MVVTCNIAISHGRHASIGTCRLGRQVPNSGHLHEFGEPLKAVMGIHRLIFETNESRSLFGVNLPDHVDLCENSKRLGYK